MHSFVRTLSQGIVSTAWCIHDIRAVFGRPARHRLAEAHGATLRIPRDLRRNADYLLHLDARKHGTDVELRIHATPHDRKNLSFTGESDLSVTRSILFCRLFLSKGRAPVLHVFFPISGYTCAFPEDLPEQEALNATMETVLSMVLHDLPEKKAKTLAAFRNQWAWERDRLEDIWAAEEFGEKVAIFSGYHTLEIGLVRRTTRINDDTCYAARQYPNSGDWRLGAVLRSDKIVARNAREVATLPDISGHEKLSLVEEISDRETDFRIEARQNFRRIRRDRQKAIPMGTHGISTYCVSDSFVYVTFEDGRKLSINLFTAMARGDKDTGSLFIGFERDGDTAKAKVRPDGTVELECDADDPSGVVRAFITAFLAADIPVPETLLPSMETLRAPDHPVLTGQDVPPRHAAFVDALVILLRDRDSDRSTQEQLIGPFPAFG